MSVFEDSRYLQTTAKTRLEDGTDYLSLRFRHEFNLEQATGYTWKEGDTLDGVAYDQYEDTDLRWVLLDANPQYRTEFDIQVGDTILVPNYDEVVDLVNGEEEE